MIAIIVGTKAELIKCAPIMLELQKKKINYWFIHTGQHPLGESCKKFGIKSPDYILSEEPELSTKFWSKVSTTSFVWFFSMIFKIRKLIQKLKPSYVLYHGDTMSSAAAAIATSKMLNFKKVWKNVHIEAGLRSGSILEPFPEELSRRICDKFSDILLAVSERSKKNLENENRKGKIIKVGNTIVDSAKMAYSLVKNKFKKPGYDYALINIHRHENLKSKNRMKAIVEILKHIKITALWPIHDNTKYFLEKYGLMNEIKKITNIKIMPLVDYFTFIFLLANSKYLVTDGGSIQEESLIFKKPCVILRKRTERQEGLTTGINFLTNLDIDYAKEIIKKIENDDLKVKNFKNPYGQPGVSKKIVSMLK